MKPFKSNHIILTFALLTCLSAFNFQLSTAFAQGTTAFSYQGRLNNNGSPVNGLYDLRFMVWDALTNGNLVAGPLTNSATGVTNGLFAVTLDFGNGVFTGPARWLELDVRTNGNGAFTTLLPFQQILPMPFAIMANTASNLIGTLAVGQLGAGTANINISGNAATATTATTATSATSATTATTANNFSGSLSGNVTGTQGATVVSTVGGQSAANVASGASAANAATSANTASTIVKRDASGNFSAGTITASLSGNATTATTATIANNFSGSLAGDVTGTQGATVVANVGGQSAANVASAVSTVNSATSANTPNTIVKRDASGNFSAGSVTLNGNLNLPATTAGAGIIYSGGSTLVLNYGDENFFAGAGAGNVTMDGWGNVGVGCRTLSANTSGSQNTANGEWALNGNTSGSQNTANGDGALEYNTSGSYNSANGSSALCFNTSGSNNTANGYQALYANYTGYNNTANGVQALYYGHWGYNNTANGFQALYYNNVGGANTANGVQALFSNSTGSANTANGADALFSNAIGVANTAEGSSALYYNTGNFNSALGYMAGYNVTNGSYNIEIGNQGVASDTSIIRIGTQGTQTNTYIAGIYGATAASGVAVYVNSSGQLGTVTSSRRFKEDIQDMGSASDVLLALHPVTFRYKPDIDPQGIAQFGLVAEDVEKVNPDLVAHDDQGRPYTVRYEAVNAMLLNEFLKEHQKVEQQGAEIEQLKEKAAKVTSLEKQLHELKQAVQSLAERR
ncbi:MAG: tail fiber domain-containing protein [Verrucomicrobiota bacterium]|jgi:hypothetical protein